jgi:hypothetical protein
MQAHQINDLNNFICGWYVDEDICDNLIELYNTKTPHRGITGVGFHVDAKDSYDVNFDHSESCKNYYSSLQNVIDQYIAKYEFCNVGNPWNVVEQPIIQKYKPPHGGYHQWHFERSDPIFTSARHLVFMTYLNNVTDAGETEFFYQKIKVRPEKGLTLIWPVDWTFTHRGIASPTQEKMIVTGWLSYVSNEVKQ